MFTVNNDTIKDAPLPACPHCGSVVEVSVIGAVLSLTCSSCTHDAEACASDLEAVEDAALSCERCAGEMIDLVIIDGQFVCLVCARDLKGCWNQKVCNE